MIYLAALLIGLSLLGALATLAISLHRLWLWWEGRQQRLGRRLRIRRSQWLSEDLLHLELVHSWRLPLPRFAPGQFITILTQPTGSRPVRRCYSLAAWPVRPWQYQLCLKREALGRMSQWLAEQALPGLPPAGHFTLGQQHGPHLLLIAGGVGITPMRAMLHALLKACLVHLSDLGLPDSRVHWEAFGARALGAGAGQFAFDWQGETLDYNGLPSLLHALHEQGVELPADCWGRALRQLPPGLQGRSGVAPAAGFGSAGRADSGLLLYSQGTLAADKTSGLEHVGCAVHTGCPLYPL